MWGFGHRWDAVASDPNSQNIDERVVEGRNGYQDADHKQQNYE
jgi:hypothetical protein